MSNSFVVVEPHADDAFLSLGGHIEKWVKMGAQVYIVGIFAGRRDRPSWYRERPIDGSRYAGAVGASYVNWDCIEGEDIEMPALDYMKTGQVILPLAVTNNDHVAVREYFEDTFDGRNFWYYLDQPYAITQKNSDRVTSLLHGKKVVSYMKPGIRKYRHIPLFKTQSKFFHFNDADKLRETCELIVR